MQTEKSEIMLQYITTHMRNGAREPIVFSQIKDLKQRDIIAKLLNR